MASHLELGSDASTFRDKSIIHTTKESKPLALYKLPAPPPPASKDKQEYIKKRKEQEEHQRASENELTPLEKKRRALYWRTPEEKEALRIKIETTLAERRAKRAQLPPPPPPPPPKPKSYTINTAWMAWVDAKGSVAKAAAAKKANPQEWLDYADNWKEEKPKPSKIKSAWTAWVEAKGSVAKGAAAKRANPQVYQDYVAKWKKENPK
jgi:hypothetical protein